jgi:hypothetical protein
MALPSGSLQIPALANYVVDSDPDGVDHDLASKPPLAFAVWRGHVLENIFGLFCELLAQG